MSDALALLELDSVASGLRALDVLVKEAPIDVLEANLVEPGKFLLLFVGGVAEVEASHATVMMEFETSILASVLIPMVHRGLVAGLRGTELPVAEGAVGVIEGTGVAHTLVAADRALKDAQVSLVGIRVAIGLGGRAFFVVSGAQHDVEASINVGRRVLEESGSLHRSELIARPHREMLPWLLRPAPFSVG
jgi:microcompartment protein CcmL/EutN